MHILFVTKVKIWCSLNDHVGFPAYVPHLVTYLEWTPKIDGP